MKGGPCQSRSTDHRRTGEGMRGMRSNLRKWTIMLRPAVAMKIQLLSQRGPPVSAWKVAQVYAERLIRYKNTQGRNACTGTPRRKVKAIPPTRKRATKNSGTWPWAVLAAQKITPVMVARGVRGTGLGGTGCGATWMVGSPCGGAVTGTGS